MNIKQENIEVGARIRALRLKNKMHQQELAEKLEKARSYISELESGRRAINLNLLLKISEIFQVDLNYFDYRKPSSKESDLKEILSQIEELRQDVEQLKQAQVK